jgi:hypothetical protein
LKATATSFTDDVSPKEKSVAALFFELIKARLTLLVVLTTLVGFYLGAPAPVDLVLMVNAILGTALVASGQRLGAYIKAGGGPPAAANGRGAYVIQPNGKIESRTRLFWLITLDPTPRPGATVVVPAKGERTASSSVLQTLSLVAQTMATLVAAIAITR